MAQYNFSTIAGKLSVDGVISDYSGTYTGRKITVTNISIDGTQVLNEQDPSTGTHIKQVGGLASTIFISEYSDTSYANLTLDSYIIYRGQNVNWVTTTYFSKRYSDTVLGTHTVMLQSTYTPTNYYYMIYFPQPYLISPSIFNLCYGISIKIIDATGNDPLVSVLPITKTQGINDTSFNKYIVPSVNTTTQLTTVYTGLVSADIDNIQYDGGLFKTNSNTPQVTIPDYILSVNYENTTVPQLN